MPPACPDCHGAGGVPSGPDHVTGKCERCGGLGGVCAHPRCGAGMAPRADGVPYCEDCWQGEAHRFPLPRAVLSSVLDLFAGDPERWTQRANARGEDGEHTAPATHTPVCWCVAGAVRRVITLRLAASPPGLCYQTGNPGDDEEVENAAAPVWVVLAAAIPSHMQKTPTKEEKAAAGLLNSDPNEIAVTGYNDSASLHFDGAVEWLRDAIELA